MEVAVVKWSRILTLALYSQCLLQSVIGGSTQKSLTSKKKKDSKLPEVNPKVNLQSGDLDDIHGKITNSKYSGKGESTKPQDVSGAEKTINELVSSQKKIKTDQDSEDDDDKKLQQKRGTEDEEEDEEMSDETDTEKQTLKPNPQQSETDKNSPLEPSQTEQQESSQLQQSKTATEQGSLLQLTDSLSGQKSATLDETLETVLPQNQQLSLQQPQQSQLQQSENQQLLLQQLQQQNQHEQVVLQQLQQRNQNQQLLSQTVQQQGQNPMLPSQQLQQGTQQYLSQPGTQAQQQSQIQLPAPVVNNYQQLSIQQQQQQHLQQGQQQIPQQQQLLQQQLQQQQPQGQQMPVFSQSGNGQTANQLPVFSQSGNGQTANQLPVFSQSGNGQTANQLPVFSQPGNGQTANQLPVFSQSGNSQTANELPIFSQPTNQLQESVNIQQRRQLLLEQLRQRYNMLKSAQNVAPNSDATKSGPAVSADMDEKITVLLQKAETQQQVTQDLLEQAQSHIGLNIAGLNSTNYTSANNYTETAEGNVNLQGSVNGVPNMGLESSQSGLSTEIDKVNSQASTSDLNFLKDDKDKGDWIGPGLHSSGIPDTLVNLTQNSTGDGKKDEDDWYYDPDSKPSKGNDFETNDDYDVSSESGMHANNIDKKGEYSLQAMTDADAIATAELENVLDTKSNVASPYLMWLKAKKNYLESPVSMLVMYSWLGCVTLVIISSLMVVKHGHKVLSYVRDSKQTRYNRDSLHAAEEARVLRRNGEVY